MTMIRMTLTMTLLFSALAAAQVSEQEVHRRLDMVHSGQLDRVRSEVNDWLKQSPNDPAVLYLDAYVTMNGDQAAKKYQAIVDHYPKSEWADDALYKVYQYYYAVGLYKTADAKLNQLNQQYPNSLFAQNEAKPSEIGIQKPAGTAPARPAPVVEEPKETAAPAAVASPGAFLVQVGVYSQEAKASETAQKMTEAVGRTAMVFSKQSGGKTVYAVAFDGFTDEQAAKTYGSGLKAKFNIDWYVVKQ